MKNLRSGYFIKKVYLVEIILVELSGMMRNGNLIPYIKVKVNSED
jgi:hypothetical protein